MEIERHVPVRRVHLPPLLLWTLLCALFFAPLLTGAARLPNSDFSGQFHAFALFQAREMAAGRLPLWSPGSNGGFPFAADTQAAVFYPPRWLAVLFSLPWGFSYYTLQLEGIAHIWLAGVFTYLLSFAITSERLAGLVAAIAFGLGGYLTSYPLLQLAILETIAWLPLVLLLLYRGMQRQQPLPGLLAAGAVLGMSALAGHPQTFLHVSYTAGAYYLFLAWRARWRWSWALGLGVLTGAVTAGMAAVAWLPAARYLAQTTRSDVTYEFVAQGFPLLDYLQVLAPRTLSFWAPQYVGLAAVCLALVAWWGRRTTDNRRSATGETVFWSIVALVAAWISLGDKGVVFELVYHVAPGFAFFRQQERLAGIVSLSLALLAAQGLTLWLRLPAADRRPLWRRLTFTMAGGLLLTGIILLMAQPIAAADWLPIWLRQWLVVAVVLALLYDGRRTTGDQGIIFGDGQRSTVAGQLEAAQFRLMTLIVFLTLDLYVSVSGAMNLQPESPAVFWPRPAWMDLLHTGAPGRFDSQNLFHANLGEIYGVEDVRGLSPLKPQVVERFEQLPRTRRWQLLNVTHVLAEAPIEPALVEVAPVADSVLPGEAVTTRLYRFEAAQPRAWMSYQPLLAHTDEEAFQIIQATGFDPVTQVALLQDENEARWAAVQVPKRPPQVETQRLASNTLAINVTTETWGILVVSEWAYPGWRATLDGEPVRLHKANYALQAILVSPGSHQVRLRFEPPDVWIGLLLSAITLLTAAVVVWYWQPVIPLRSVPARTPSGRERVAFALQAGWMPVQKWRWLLLLIVFIGFGLRLFNLGKQELRGDEAFSYLFGRIPLTDIVPALLEEGDPHSPLHYLLLHGWMTLSGDSEFAMRYVSLIPGVLLLPLLGQLGRQFGGPRLGLLAALLAATSQSLVWVSQDMRNQYTLALFFTILATLVLARLTAPSLPAGTRGKIHLWLAYALLAALAIYSHYYSVAVLLAHGAFILGQPARRRWLWRWLSSGVVAALLFTPWLLTVGPRLIAAGQLSDLDTPELAHHLAVTGVELAAGSAVGGWWPRWLFLVVAILAVIGGRALFQVRPDWAALLVGWLAGTALLIYLVRFSRATFNAFYITLAAPAWWLLVAVGMMVLWQHRLRWQPVLASIGLAAVLTAAVVGLRNYYVDPAYSRTLGYRQMVAHVAAEAQVGDLFLAHFPDPSLVYYLRHLSLPYQMQPATYKAPTEVTEAALADLAANFERLWFVPMPDSAWDAENVVPRWLEVNTLPEQSARYQRLALLAYRPLHAADQILTPIDATFNQSIRLEGTLVTINGIPANLSQPVPLEPGSTVQVTLVWEALANITDHLTVFVHLVDGGGMLVTQHDGVPLNGLRPTVTWTTGERLIDTHTLTVPAATTFSDGRLVVGLYRTETLERLLTSDSRDAIADAVAIAVVRLTPR